jgi:hypothetical protein
MPREQWNPFAVQTPETMNAAEIVQLFVEVADLEKVERSGHVFIHGHRGSGKSMIFRMMSPDCQTIKRQCQVKELPYFCIYLSIKLAYLDIPEFERLNGQTASYILSEHMLVTHLASKTFKTVLELCQLELEQISTKTDEFLSSFAPYLTELFRRCGWTSSLVDRESELSGADLFKRSVSEIDTVLGATITYLQRISFQSQLLPYDGPLLSFQGFLLPILRKLRQLSLLPDRPFYILIDDADNLNFEQTQVLNTWVAQRNTDYLSLKISTQLRYKTYLTTTSRRIESPHDYSEIHASTVLTGSSNEGYQDWVRQIVEKRLIAYGIAGVAPDDFFPEDKNQKEKIIEIEQEIRSGQWQGSGRGFRPQDDVYRYARPEYIRRLGGQRKGTYRYSYSGFKQLVHVSSGIIRYFLEPASLMFSEQQKRNAREHVTSIDSDIQSTVLREQSDQLMFYEFDKLSRDIARMKASADEHDELAARRLVKLRNLIEALGATFYQALIDEARAERRYFSVLLNDSPTDDILTVLRLGVELGYLYELVQKMGWGEPDDLFFQGDSHLISI